MALMQPYQKSSSSSKSSKSSSSSSSSGQKFLLPVSAGGGTVDSYAAYKAATKNLVSSSAPVVADEERTAKMVNGLMAPDMFAKSLEEATNRFMSILGDYQNTLTNQFKEDKNAINEGFDVERTNMENKQEREGAGFRRDLVNVGGHLGNSMSSSGAVRTLARSFREESVALEAKRNSALLEARRAIQEKQFGIAKEMAQQAVNFEKELYARQNDFFNNTLRLRQEERSQSTFDRQLAQDKMTMLAKLPQEELDAMDPSTFQEIDAIYGVEGMTKNYLNVVAEAERVKSEKEALTHRQNLLNFLQDIPKGQTVKFPDGTEYTGLGSTDDISTFQVTDDYGNVRMVTYNKGSGETTSINLGALGKTASYLHPSKPSSSDVAESNKNTRLSEASSALEELRGSNGIVSGDDFVFLYQEYNKNYPGKGKEFLDAFNSKLYTGTEEKYLQPQNQTRVPMAPQTKTK